ncbi:glycerol-3-phosphate dehydrogenase/oxidase [Corynebacterium aquatimens]|uniref:Glycerol-3-phosphate dehydrogenase n=1 Tax=Corynebacterium aquatimens TaxID=1190508 RepID=A0A931DW80_9CORY|nr:glycerol-3-phosphate dehydrogenase/oxidase [Corynebacterium aquatimens]MBG6122649.1 glycerol-3-phosphate dehydrogenase [Corynebacterium aquatimens]WJY64813.1 Aerobic glycerol-3-phosphate dehydrogenase [Corynebacterium aquatimens]
MSNTPAFDPARTILSPAYREQLLSSLTKGQDQYDLIVIGAGITGAGVALDAASRGLKILVVEARDIAFGTSRWSSKLAHGGLRYLATGSAGVARRSAIERGKLMDTIAPHLVRALPQVVPLTEANKEAVLQRLGFAAGDALRVAAGTSSSVLPRSRVISAERVKELCPTVRKDVKWGFLNYDGQLIDDARLVTAVIRTAMGYGADVLLGARASVAPGRRDGAKVVTLDIDDRTIDVPTIDVAAAGVVNATGVWAGELENKVTIIPSRGTHLVIDAEKVGNPTGALTVAVPGSPTRFCFILPAQMGHCYLGITDDLATIEDEPSVPEEDITFILDVVNGGLETKLTRDDVIGAFAGLRPLVKFGDGESSAEEEIKTSDLSRDHLILTTDGVVTVTGGKLTEYRLMAEQTVDAMLNDESISTNLTSPASECQTKRIPLVGASYERSPHEAWASTGANAEELPESLVARYGAEARNVLAASIIPNGADRVADLDLTRAEISYAVTHEGARSVDDILDRRTRVGFVAADRAAAEPVAREVFDALP